MWNHLDVPLKYMIRRQTFEGWEIRPRYIDEHEFVLVLKGFGNIMIDDRNYCVKAGDLICFRPGVKHSLWLTQEPYMEFYGMHVELPNDVALPSIPDFIHLEAPMRLEPLFKALYDVYLQKGYLYEWRQNLLLQQLLCEIFTILHEKDEPIGALRVRKVLEYIHEDPCRPLTLEDLLAHAGIRKTVFMQSFRSVTGTTPIQYIIWQRLEYAHEFLLDSDLPIAQIAEKCGFTDPFYFSRCFRQRFSMSPKQYRDFHRM